MSSFAICQRKNETAFEVFCIRCRESIGTMTGDDVSSAIQATRERGGVLCPKCREASCKHCGALLSGNSKDGICWFCECELKIQEREQDNKVSLV